MVKYDHKTYRYRAKRARTWLKDISVFFVIVDEYIAG